MGKHKGDRVFRGVRLPQHVNEALLAAAERDGLNFNDFIVNAIAAHCGLPEPIAVRPTIFQPEELPLKAS